MISKLLSRRTTPIGVDIGTRSIKLVQLSADHNELIDAASGSCEFDGSQTREQVDQVAGSLGRVLEGRGFRGRDAVICLDQRHLFLQNMRVPKADQASVERSIQQEAAGRIPFPVAEAEMRFLEAADIRHGDAVMREVILMACHRPVLDRAIEMVERAGLRPVAVDVEPAAIMRSHVSQFRREQDHGVRSILVQVGYSSTAVTIVEGDHALFIKYIELGGKDLDEAVAQKLQMQIGEASALRRHNGDRRSDRQDPEIARSVSEATRPVVERLASELSKCVRYHSVTFRGSPLTRFVLSGGEATQQLLDLLGKRLSLQADLSDPLRVYPARSNNTRKGQWDVATGLALRQLA